MECHSHCVVLGSARWVWGFRVPEIGVRVLAVGCRVFRDQDVLFGV